MFIRTIAATCALAFLPLAATAQTRPADTGVPLTPFVLAVPVDGPDQPPSGKHAPPTPRRKDSLWNGVIIGAGLGALVGAVVGAAVLDCSECAGFNVPLTFGVLGAGAGAGIGAGIDAWRQTRAIVTTTPIKPRRLTVSPVLGRDVRGMVATIRF